MPKAYPAGVCVRYNIRTSYGAGRGEWGEAQFLHIRKKAGTPLPAFRTHSPIRYEI